MRVALAATLVAALAAAGAAPAEDDVPTRDCRTRAESGRAPLPFKGANTIVAGPVAFSGLARAAAGLGPRGEDGRYSVKSPANVRAGRRVLIEIPARWRSRLQLRYAPGFIETSATRFVPCAPATRAFSYAGRVGAVTGFPGGFVLTAAGCYPLDVRVEGGRLYRIRIPFGYPCR